MDVGLAGEVQARTHEPMRRLHVFGVLGVEPGERVVGRGVARIGQHFAHEGPADALSNQELLLRGDAIFLRRMRCW